MPFRRWIIFSGFSLSCLVTFSIGLEANLIDSSTPIFKKYERNEAILNRSPTYFWNENKYVFHWGFHSGENPIISKGGYQSKGAAGVIPYVVYEDKAYVLLARETWGADKNTYCDLGGAVEVYGSKDNFLYADTFLYTLLKEGAEESGGLYEFTEHDFLEHAHVISYTYKNIGFYDGFESVLAFFEVDEIYYTEQFLTASQQHAIELENLYLCPWGYQEKDDYQWIELSSLYRFLKEADCNEGVFINIFNNEIQLRLRPHFATILRSNESLKVLSTILQGKESLTFVDETSLYTGSIGKMKAMSSNKIGDSSPLGTTAMASYNDLSCGVE